MKVCINCVPSIAGGGQL